jgi:hypothetical protein
MKCVVINNAKNFKEESVKPNETFHSYFPDMNGTYFSSAFLSFLKTKQF